MRSALVALLKAEGSFEVWSTGCRTAAGRARSLQPHVRVVDVDCPGSAALLEECSESPDRAVGPVGALLVLATAGRPGLIRRAFEARALGYIDKDGSPCRLVQGIRKVAKGERFIDESLAFGFLQAAEMPLTPRELSVLARAAEGESIAEIATGLHLSNGTVRNYMASVTRKVGARNRIDAIRISQGAGWV
jgi:two-component system response regulator DesR